MTKQEFLTQLKDRLLPHMNYSEMMNTLEYYNDYIEDGMLEKDEATIINELGDLDELVDSLLKSFKELDLEEKVELEGICKIETIDFDILVEFDDQDSIECKIPSGYEDYFKLESSMEGYHLKQIEKLPFNKHGSLKIALIIPESYHDGIDLKTQNHSIRVEGEDQILAYIKAVSKNASIIVEDIHGNLDLLTGNGKIVVADCHGENLKVKSSNAGIKVEDTRYRQASITTSNGSVILDDTRMAACVIETSNAGVSIEDSDISDLSVKTSNGKIEMSDSKKDVTIDYITSNGRVELFDHQYPMSGNVVFQNGTYQYHFITSNGKIVVED